MESRKDTNNYPYKKAPRNWGRHPDFNRSFMKHMALCRRQARRGNLKVPITGKLVFLSELSDLQHPEVVVIPRDRYISVSYTDQSPIGFEQIAFPFSSTDFYTNLYGDLSSDGVFPEIRSSCAFWRLGDIIQLGHLIPPIPEEFGRKRNIAYIFPQFPHTRWIHSLLTAVLGEVILARNGFEKRDRDPFVLTAGHHDCALPAGGDSVKRIDPGNLDEETNFSWVLEYHGLPPVWAKKFGFNLDVAQSWVKGEGMLGRFLDVIDKIAYTALDCYWLGSVKQGDVRSLCQQNPLIMDVWQDIVFLPDRSGFAFLNPERLFLFLLLRAFEHKELLLDPYARTFDFLFEKLVRPLYEKGVITKGDLLTEDEHWLRNVLESHYHITEFNFFYVEPAEIPWKKFETLEDQQAFCKEMGDKIDHIDNITGFNTGLDFPVFQDGKILPVREVLSQERVDLLEGIAKSTKGYHVYYRL